MSLNSFGARSTLSFGGRDYEIYRLDALEKAGLDITRLPYSLKILLENLLRNEDGKNVAHDDIRTLAQWDPKSPPTADISFMPGRVLMQDFTGVPLVVDLATMRDAVVDLGGDPDKVNPLSPAEMVIDHSVQVDVFGTRTAVQMNTELEYQRNQERYAFLRWAQTAFENFKVVPPRTGIVHQVNLEYLARVVFAVEKGGKSRMFHLNNATVPTVRDVLVRNVDRRSDLHTDESRLYTATGSEFASHETVNHSAGEYARGDVTTNHIENVFSVFKRGMVGVYQHCGEAHLHRYLAEFDFRYNRRTALKVTDAERHDQLLAMIEGKRLTYRRIGEADYA